MRKILMLVVMVVMAVVAMAQNPKISYQAVVRDAQNRLAANTTLDVTVTITYGSSLTYSETHNSIQTNQNGLMSLLIGGTPEFAAIDWTNATITTTFTIAGTNITNTVPVNAVPYAMYAHNVNPTVIDTLVSEHELEVILNNYYTKTGVDTLLGAKVDTSALKTTLENYYTKTGVDTLLAAKVDTADLKTTLENYYTKTGVDTLLAAKVDTSALKTALEDYYTKIGVDTLLAAKADTSDIHDATVTFYKPDNTELTSFTLNTENNQDVHLPGNPMTLKFIRPLDTIVYNAFDENGLPQEYLIDLTDVITTQAIVKYINKAQATSSVNDVDSIYNALTDPANADVKEELIRKAKQVAINHERDAMDIALEYFKHFDGDDVRYILDRVDSANIAQFINSVNTLTPADANKIMGALAANVKAAQVGQLVKALSDRISAAQAREFINAVIGNIDASQVDVLIDTLNDAANADANSAAGRLKARIDAHINALIEARIQQYISTGH